MFGDELEEKINPDENQGSRTKIFVSAALIVVVLLSLAGGIFWFQKKAVVPEKIPSIPQAEEKPQVEARIINENTEAIEEAPVGENDDSGLLSSENYKINNINIGGNVMLLPNEENRTLQITNVKSSSFLDDKKGEAKLIVTWQTNTMAISEIEYAKNNGENPKVVKEESYGFGHSATISGLEPGKAYIYQIKCKDRWGNGDSSEYFGAFTSSKPVSIFDLIFAEMKKIFGWAMK